MSKSINRITFVWNADFSVAGGLRALKEVVQGEHSCSLCELAYHRVTQTSDWKAYKESLASQLRAEIREPCKNQLDESEREIAAGDFPAVLAHVPQGIIKLLGGEEVDSCGGEFSKFKEKLDAAIESYLSQS